MEKTDEQLKLLSNILSSCKLTSLLDNIMKIQYDIT